MQANRLGAHGRVEHIPTGPDAIIPARMKAVLNGTRSARCFAADLTRDRAARRLTAACSCRASCDDKEIQLKSQSQIFFQISGAGHEAMLVAAGLTLQARLRLVLSLLSRSRRSACSSAMTPLDMLLAAVGAKDDPSSGGRQMPSHWGHTALQHRLRLEPDRHAGPARRRRRRRRRHLQPRPADSPTARRSLPGR